MQKLHENDGRNEKFEGMLAALIEQNRITQQVLESEWRNREKGNSEISNKISVICSAIGKQQNLLATNQQACKEELMQEVEKKVECGFPSELKNEIGGRLFTLERIPVLKRTHAKYPIPEALKHVFLRGKS